jgi:hypothetical protein
MIRRKVGRWFKWFGGKYLEFVISDGKANRPNVSTDQDESRSVVTSDRAREDINAAVTLRTNKDDLSMRRRQHLFGGILRKRCGNQAGK